MSVRQICLLLPLLGATLTSCSPTPDKDEIKDPASQMAPAVVPGGPVKPQAFLENVDIGGLVNGAMGIVGGIYKLARSDDTSKDSGVLSTINSILSIVDSIVSSIKMQFCRLFGGIFSAGENGEGTPCGGSGSESSGSSKPKEYEDVDMTKSSADTPAKLQVSTDEQDIAEDDSHEQNEWI